MQFPVSFYVSPELTIHPRQEEMEIKKGGTAFCKEKQGGGRDSCSSYGDPAGGERTLEKSQTPGETQGHTLHCGMLPSCITPPR
ncbi:hypothetical protein PBY51_012838 [Eleginops maclovinus]|uniref:Uncharacterized protein n=1 Tax=Eleginops maclovinus TaxID=56733 RepID=A0AAN8AXG6_ELEMC|nr:hypothetical protein PBY51_012838 [Eleginops maclovinus]